MLEEERPLSAFRRWVVWPVVASLFAAASVVAPVTASHASAAATDTSLFVSPTGDDSNSGSVASPFRTVERARDVVRTLNSNMTGDIVIYLRGGSYPVDNTIQFGPADSGTNGHRVVYSAYPNEVPVLEAGTQITGWTQHSGNIWKAALDRNNKLRALYVDGDRFEMAKKTVQSAGCYGSYTVTAGQAPWAWESGSECDGSRYSLADVPAITRNQQDMELRTQTTWTTAITGIRQVTTTPDGSQRLALFQQPGAAIAQGALNGDLQAAGSQTLSNAYEFLDEPGEFYYDRQAKTVYAYKDAATNFATAAVFAPDNVETIVNVAGSSTSQRVRDLTFTGITFRHSDWNLAQVDGSVFKQGQQGNLINLKYARKNFHDYSYRNVAVQPGAIEVNNASGLQFVRNRVEHTGADGIQLLNDVVDSRVEGNLTDDIAGSALDLGDPQHVYIGDGTSSNGERYVASVEGLPRNIAVRNNFFYDSAVLFAGSAAISGYYLDSVAIESNRIERTSWAGISMGWGWRNFNGDSQSVNPGNPTIVARNNSIQRNEIFDSMRILNDSGALYTLGDQRGSVITDNSVRGIRPGHTYGIHPDEGSANLTYNNNVIEADRNIAYVINSGVWGAQNHLQIHNTWGPINSIFDKNVPDSVIEDVRVVPDLVWPAEAYAVTVGAGIEPAFRDVLGNLAKTADFALPSSSVVNEFASSLPVRGVGDAARKMWLAPAATTSFAPSATMSTAAGDATSILLPQSRGEYKLYVLDANGAISSTSTATVVRTAAAPRNQTITHSDSQRCLDVPGGSTQNGTQPALWTCGGDANQRFTYTVAEEIRVYGNKCLDAFANGTTDGTRVVIWDCSGQNNQKWTLSGNGAIVSKSSGLCLALTGARTDNGAPGQLSTCNGSSAQRWKFPLSQETIPASATLVLNDAQLCLDIPGASTQNGTQAALWACKGDNNQRITYTSAGELKVYGTKCLDALYNGSADGTAVGIWDCNGGDNQKWTLNASGTIVGKASGLCLATTSGRVDSTAPIQLSTCTYGSKQRWTARG